MLRTPIKSLVFFQRERRYFSTEFLALEPKAKKREKKKKRKMNEEQSTKGNAFAIEQFNRRKQQDFMIIRKY